jgi:hypothetical protein
VVFLTGLISPEQEMMVDNKDGSYMFLSKPIRPERVLDEVNRILASGA